MDSSTGQSIHLESPIVATLYGPVLRHMRLSKFGLDKNAHQTGLIVRDFMSLGRVLRKQGLLGAISCGGAECVVGCLLLSRVG